MKSIVLCWIMMAPALLPQEVTWESVRDEARSRYEILMLMIQNEQFDTFLEESKELFGMKFPPDKEDRVVEGALQMTDALVFHKRLDLAQAVLDQCAGTLGGAQHMADVMREKAYIFKKMGQDQDAMDYFKKALGFEKEAKRSP